MTAIADRNRAGFIQFAWLWIGVFAAATVVSVISRFTEERLALLWRVFLAQRSVHVYSRHRVYFHVGERSDIGNPDQRIADDIKTFTAATLSFTLMLIHAGFTVVAFAGVLWSISPLLMTVAVLYAALGSYFTVRLGRPLVRLNFNQLDKEADFRSGLIYLKENADAVALSRREIPLTRRLVERLAALAENQRAIIGVNRNVGFFATFYNWLIQIIPALFVAPLFIDGEVEFGVITQSAMAFTALLGAFSLIVTQFQSISSFAAVLARLSSFSEAIEQECGLSPTGRSRTRSRQWAWFRCPHASAALTPSRTGSPSSPWRTSNCWCSHGCLPAVPASLSWIVRPLRWGKPSSTGF